MFNQKNKKAASGNSQAATEEIKENFPHGFETETVRMTASPYHKKGEEVTIGKTHAQKLIKKGWAEALIVSILMLASLGSIAQSQSEQFVNAGFPTVLSDTVTNTGTAVLVSPIISGGGTSTAITVKVVEISGTTGGTFLLEGCLVCDGTDWAATTVAGTSTATGTPTITDTASKSYTWWFQGSPYRKYRITHTGTGTMSDRDFAWIVKK